MRVVEDSRGKIAFRKIARVSGISISYFLLL